MDSWICPDDFYEPPAAPEVKAVELCSHCHTEPESRKSKPLCSKCYRYRRDTGELPSPELLDQRERIAWQRLDPDYTSWENRPLHHKVRVAFVDPMELYV